MNVTDNLIMERLQHHWMMAHKYESHTFKDVMRTIETYQDLLIYGNGSPQLIKDLQFLWAVAFEAHLGGLGYDGVE